MTRISGSRILAARCCGARYSAPQFSSMNFMAWEHWTDGWRDGSLMPNDTGIRRCICGEFFLAKELILLEVVQNSDLPTASRVPAVDLPRCIAEATSESIEIAARLEYWWALHHEYREFYRQHRDAEEAATKLVWEKQNPDKRTWWERLRGVKPIPYQRPDSSPFTTPPFYLSQIQEMNMRALISILQSQLHLERFAYSFELAELYRELGEFDNAQRVLLSCHKDQIDGSSTTYSLLMQQIERKESALMRYRM